MRKRLASTSVARRPRASATEPAERMDTSMYTFMEPAAVLPRQLVEKKQERKKEAPSPTSSTPPPFVSSKMITFDQQKLPGTVYNTPN
jgi:uncharacterized protein (DUF3084 family)